jgi:hypothetical protein
MRKVFLPVLLASALALAALCAPALAQTDSAVDEYQESIPGAGGGPSSNEGGQGGGGSGMQPVHPGGDPGQVRRDRYDDRYDGDDDPHAPDGIGMILFTPVPILSEFRQ